MSYTIHVRKGDRTGTIATVTDFAQARDVISDLLGFPYEAIPQKDGTINCYRIGGRFNGPIVIVTPPQQVQDQVRVSQ